MQRPTPTIAWLTPDQVGAVRHLAETANLDITHAGCPEPTLGTAVAQALNVPAATDLRAAIATATEGLVLIASPGAFAGPGTMSRTDAEELDAARDRGVKVVTLEPLPGALVQLAEIGHAASTPTGPARGLPGAWCEYLPLARLAPRVLDLGDVLEHLGRVRSVRISVVGPARAGTLGARLLDAIDLAHRLLGVPESVFAAYTGTEAGPLHALPGQSLRDLHGDICATLVYDAGTAASLHVSNRAGRYTIETTVLGANGRVSISDDRLLWLDADGNNIDAPGQATELPTLDPAQTPDAFWLSMLTTQINNYISTGAGQMNQLDYPRLLATAQAALLSSRTGEPESPATMLKLAGA